MVLAWTRRRRGRRRCREVPSPGVSPYRNLDVAHSLSLFAHPCSPTLLTAPRPVHSAIKDVVVVVAGDCRAKLPRLLRLK